MQVYLSIAPALLALLGAFMGAFFQYKTNEKSRRANQRVIARQELRIALRAARLTVLELKYNCDVLSGARTRQRWWKEEDLRPFIEAWWEYRGELASRLSSATWKQVADACTEIHLMVMRTGERLGSDLLPTDAAELKGVVERSLTAADALEAEAIAWESAPLV